MNYHNITKDDMLNGDGLRVVLWVSGCTHHCHGCQNPITWDVAGGIPFDKAAEDELFEALSKPHISGITFSGGDPLHPFNRDEVFRLIKKIRNVEGRDEIMTNASRIINREIRKQRKAGLEQGLEQGFKQGIIQIAKKLKREMSIKDISRITGLTEQEIENL